jgi:hypothetical protein
LFEEFDQKHFAEQGGLTILPSSKAANFYLQRRRHCIDVSVPKALGEPGRKLRVKDINHKYVFGSIFPNKAVVIDAVMNIDRLDTIPGYDTGPVTGRKGNRKKGSCFFGSRVCQGNACVSITTSIQYVELHQFDPIATFGEDQRRRNNNTIDTVTGQLIVKLKTARTSFISHANGAVFKFMQHVLKGLTWAATGCKPSPLHHLQLRGNAPGKLVHIDANVNGFCHADPFLPFFYATMGLMSISNGRQNHPQIATTNNTMANRDGAELFFALWG